MESASLNTTFDIFQEIENSNSLAKIMFVVPEYINVFLVITALYGMYQGIEIKHPLYSILFSNMIITLATSLVDIIAYGLIPINKYVIVTNIMNSQSVQYHCSSWCLTTVLRYVYIFHEDWISYMKRNIN